MLLRMYYAVGTCIIAELVTSPCTVDDLDSTDLKNDQGKARRVEARRTSREYLLYQRVG